MKRAFVLGLSLLLPALAAAEPHVRVVPSGGGAPSSGGSTGGSGGGSSGSSGPVSSGGGGSIGSSGPSLSNGGPVHVRPVSSQPSSTWRGTTGGPTSPGSGGSYTTSRPVGVVPRSGSSAPSSRAVVGNTSVIRSIEHGRNVEVVPNKYYWHDVGGTRYCHYYNRGVNWYGFYDGPSFYWTRYDAGYWWWFDAGYNRWLFWNAGYWWWAPSWGVNYVYVNNQYQPYEQANLDVDAPEPPPNVGTPRDAPAPSHQSWTSPDGRRMIQVFGDRSEAFLYDRGVNPPKYLAYLGANVERVRFSEGKNGKGTQILVDFKDGNFALFSQDGRPTDGPIPNAEASPIQPPPAPPGR